MQVHSIQANNTNSRQTFTGVKLLAGAQETLKKQLNSSDEIKRFRNIVTTQDNASFADLYLFGDGKKITARIVSKDNFSTESIIMQKKQAFWQSTISFLEKMSDKTTKIERDLGKKYNLQSDLDEIIETIEKV